MNKKMKEELKNIYQVPGPYQQRAFFRKMKIQTASMGVGRMLFIQVTYISKWEWVLSVALFGMLLLIGRLCEPIMLSAAVSMMPFLAVASISESVRSIIYGMEGFERAARFSLKSIVLARMGIMGTENLILALIFSAIMQGRMLCTMLYLLVPYLLTVYIGLVIVRHYPDKEGIYLCMGTSISISVMLAVSTQYYVSWIFQERFIAFWMAAVAMLADSVLKENRRIGIWS